MYALAYSGVRVGVHYRLPSVAVDRADCGDMFGKVGDMTKAKKMLVRVGIATGLAFILLYLYAARVYG